MHLPSGTPQAVPFVLETGVQMCLITRHGITEMFEYLSTFCDFYVYSHGIKDYILRIIEILDPYEKFFKLRDQRVLAPKDQIEQMQMRENHKAFTDLRHPADASKPLFSQAELARTLIIDDQFCAIHENFRGK